MLLRLWHEDIDPKTVSQEFRKIEAKSFDEWPLLTPGNGIQFGDGVERKKRVT